MKCNLCPRACNVDRNVNTGFCGMTNDIYAARAALHMWEEPCISGEHGSGAVFFSGCTLRCIFCQNAEIAAAHVGKKITVERLSDIFLELQDKCANNINLVTATHFVPQVRGLSYQLCTIQVHTRMSARLICLTGLWMCIFQT